MRKKKKVTERGLRLAESKALSKSLSQKFPIGEMVTQKYYPDFVGVVSSKPKVVRYHNQFGEYLESTIEVLWIKSKFFGDGQTHAVSCDQIIRRKEKKVL